MGHVRYATSFRDDEARTAGVLEVASTQPLVGVLPTGPFVLVHSGQVRLRPVGLSLLGARASDAVTDSAWLVALLEAGTGDLLERVAALAGLVEGAFSLVVATTDELVIARDNFGIRPLFVGFGPHDERVVVASEPFPWPEADIVWHAATSSLVRPGTARAFRRARTAAGAPVIETREQPASTAAAARASRAALCLLETIYFGAPTTVLVGEDPVGIRRERLGEALAQQENPTDVAGFDLVVGVPDSGLSAARGFARTLGLPIEPGLRRSATPRRSFLAPTQALRELIVVQKLTADPDVVRGKSVVVLDDSVVRGTTSTAVARMLRQAGARAVHLRLASPRLAHPCRLGVDMPTRAELVAHVHPEDSGLAAALGYDSIRFLPLERVVSIAGGSACVACVTGREPAAEANSR